MSYNIDGKIANQFPKEPACSKCHKMLVPPKSATLAELSGNKIFTICSYIDTFHFIYESKSGKAVVYCSDYCRRKHNHRFQK
jgi:RNase P subunit RPR2